MKQDRTIEISITRVLFIVLAIIVLVVIISTRFWETGSGEPIETPTAEETHIMTFEEASRAVAEDLLDYPLTGNSNDLVEFRDALNEDLYTEVFWEWFSEGDNYKTLPSYGLAGGAPDPVFVGGPIILWQKEKIRDVAYQYELGDGSGPANRLEYGQIEFRMWKIGDEWKMAKVLANTRRSWQGEDGDIVQPDASMMEEGLPQDAALVVEEFIKEQITGLPTSERNPSIYTENWFQMLQTLEERQGEEELAKWAVAHYTTKEDPIVLWVIPGFYDLAVVTQAIDDAGEPISGGYIIVEFRLVQEESGEWKVSTLAVHKPRNEYEGIEGMVWP